MADTGDFNENTIIKLVSKRQLGFSVDLKYRDISISTYISTSFQQDPSKTVFIVDIKPDTLQAIARYCQEHGGKEPRIIEPPLRSRRMHEVCEKIKDAEFIDDVATRSPQLLYDLAVGALYLQIQSLVHLACAKVASSIKSHPLDKVKGILLNNTPPTQGQ
eukprot:UN01492